MQIYIIPLDFEDEEILDRLAISLKQVFQIPISYVPIDINLKKGWSQERSQLNSTWILSQFLEKGPNDNSKILGVTVYDLYTPILTFLFGEAELEGRAAVFSIYRFQDELYGLSANQENLEKRILKEAVHELGHTFGLHHCRNYDCVMHSSIYIEEFDFKSENFCEKCKSILHEKMNN